MTSGASVESISNPVHCLANEKATIKSVYASFAVPFALVLAFAGYFSYIAYRNHKGVIFVLQRSVLSFCAVFYFTYLALTRQSVLVFYPAYVSGEILDNTTSIAEAARSTTCYWALDTSVLFDSAEHDFLKIGAGFVLAVFTFGFPIIVGTLIICVSKGTNDRAHLRMYDMFGFFYRAYDEKHRYWESLVMLRKALLSVTAVFASLGGGRQGLLATMILFVCFFFHTMTHPFRSEFEVLNIYEAFSLCLSGLIFLLSCFFEEGKSTQGVRNFLSVVIVLIIVGFVCVMLRAIYLHICLYLRASLESSNIRCNEQGIKIVVKFIRIRFKALKRMASDIELVLSKQKNRSG